MQKSSLTFKGGIHPKYCKELTNKLPIETCPASKEIVIPLSMHIGAPAQCVVNPGDRVLCGTVLAQAGGFVSSDIHSSVSGTVKAVEKRLTQNGMAMCCVIENDFEYEEAKFEAHDPETMTGEELAKLVSDKGLVGLGGATFPLRVKFSPSPDTPIDHMIVNGAECEPYLSSDHAALREYPEKLVKGLKIAMKILGQEKGYIAIEDNKLDVIEGLEKYADDSIEIKVVETKYPQGGEKQLINALTGREVPSGGLPAAVGCIVSNVGTIIALYDAVYEGKPLYERICTVTGKGIKEPKVLKFRVGTSVRDMIDYCGGLTDDVAKVILGGPMMGFAIYDTNVPAAKGTSGILCMNHEEADMDQPSNCLRCGKCIEVCPMHLMPLYFGLYAAKGEIEKCLEYNVLDCIECGCCSFTCPSHRPLVASIRMAKAESRKLKK